MFIGDGKLNSGFERPKNRSIEANTIAKERALAREKGQKLRLLEEQQFQSFTKGQEAEAKRRNEPLAKANWEQSFCEGYHEAEVTRLRQAAGLHHEKSDPRHPLARGKQVAEHAYSILDKQNSTKIGDQWDTRIVRADWKEDDLEPPHGMINDEEGFWAGCLEFQFLRE